MQHHDALRLRFEQNGTHWVQTNAGAAEAAPLICIDLSMQPEAEQTATLEVIAAQIQAGLHLTIGPLMRGVYFQLGHETPSRLLLVLHHLVVDGVSWRVLLEDLQVVYQQLSQAQSPQLPAKTTSFKTWATALVEHAQSPVMMAEVDYWQHQPWHQVQPLPLDYPDGKNYQSTTATLSAMLTAAETDTLIHEMPPVYHTHINEVLLAALAQAFQDWTGHSTLLVDLEGHGREDIIDGIDISRTVGWFTTLFPVLLDTGHKATPDKLLKSVKEQMRRIPNQGIGYGLLRYLSPNYDSSQEWVDSWSSLPRADVAFNYLGQLDKALSKQALFMLATESSGPTRSPRHKRQHALEIIASVIDNRLSMTWNYSEECFLQATIKRVAQHMLDNLRMLIVHSLTHNAGGFTPTDFPLTNLTQQQLEDLPIASSYTVQDVQDLYPLSPLQQGLLFLNQYTPRAQTYHSQFSFMLEGTIDCAALQQAWQQTIAAHAILRTGIIWDGLPEPLQIVYNSAHLPWEEHDWRGDSTAVQDEKLKALLQADLDHGFDFMRPPLIRLFFIRLTDHDTHFLWSQHHILLDGWSTFLLFKEILRRYEALQRQEEVQLAQNSPYRDYIAWLGQQDICKAEAYWRRVVGDFTSPTSTKVLEQRSYAPTNHHEEYELEQFQLSTSLTTSLQSVARQHQLTLNTIIQGGWALLLSYYSGDEDVLFGVTTSGRPAALAGVESMVGLFINTLPIRVKLPPNNTLLPWFLDLQERQAEARQYEYCTLADVQRWSKVPYGQPLFESIIVFLNYPIDASLLEHAHDISPAAFAVKSAAFETYNHYPLTIQVIPGDKLTFKVLYDARRFQSARIVHMLQHWEVLLNQLAAQPASTTEVMLQAFSKLDAQVQGTDRTLRKQTNAKRLTKMKRRAIRKPLG